MLHMKTCDNSSMKFFRMGNKKVTVKRSRYRPGVAQMVGRGIAVLFNYRSNRRG